MIVYLVAATRPVRKNPAVQSQPYRCHKARWALYHPVRSAFASCHRAHNYTLTSGRIPALSCLTHSHPSRICSRYPGYSFPTLLVQDELTSSGASNLCDESVYDQNPWRNRRHVSILTVFGAADVGDDRQLGVPDSGNMGSIAMLTTAGKSADATSAAPRSSGARGLDRIGFRSRRY